MGAGKTTAARSAAQALGGEAVDVDEQLEERLGKPISRVFAEDGEARFREAEEALTLELLDRARVLSLGGGVVGSSRVREALRRHRVVWIDAEPEVAWSRSRETDRPLAVDRDRFLALMREREPIYFELADAIVPEARTREMGAPLAALAELPAPARLLWAANASGDYPVLIGDGVRRLWPRAIAGGKFLVSDVNVEPLYAGDLEPCVDRIVIEAGEASKTLGEAEAVLSQLARAGMRRHDVVIALGGGVVGDLAGFCAATYQRGVRWVGVPTSLVAQVDSAYGGKTGVDLPEAKNYVGAYHQPTAVLADPQTLTSLPAPELAGGYAEVIKTALIAGGDLWRRVREGATPTDRSIIAGCVRTKLRIVAQDERDRGLRQVLNLGHTVAHAIETTTAYRRYRHGEAVALGLLAALRLSGQEALRAEVRELLLAHGLPVTLSGADPEAVVMATARDKKRTGQDRVPFVLLEAPGRPLAGQSVPDRDVMLAVRELTPR
jgi:shikimate kinase/3-dehydroquinate synthase